MSEKFDLKSWLTGVTLGLAGRSFSTAPKNSVMLAGWLSGRRIAGGRGQQDLNVIPKGGTYYIGVTSTSLGDYTGATRILTAGDAFPETVSSGDVYVYEDYEYRYGYRYGGISATRWSSLFAIEWGVRVLDDTKSAYTDMLSTINGKDVASVYKTFADCAALVTAPAVSEKAQTLALAFKGCTSLADVSRIAIPSSISTLTQAFEGCTSLEDLSGLTIMPGVRILRKLFYGCTGLRSIFDLQIPSSVVYMDDCFYGCVLLADVSGLVIPYSVTNLDRCFYGCENMTGTIRVDGEEIYYEGITNNCCTDCFYGTVQPITLTGTGTEANTAVLELLAATANNGNVTITDATTDDGLEIDEEGEL